MRDGQERFEADAGVVVRHYQASASGLTFSLKAERPVAVVTREFDAGELNFGIDGKPAGKVRVQQSRASFHLPAGEHTVDLAR